LSDIELAVLLCLVAEQHCIIESDRHLLDGLEQELRIVWCMIHFGTLETDCARLHQISLGSHMLS
jgi:hypothetical protein